MSRDQATRNKATARRFCEAMNTGNAGGISRTIDELVKPDAQIRTSVPIAATGPDKLKDVCDRNTVTGTH